MGIIPTTPEERAAYQRWFDAHFPRPARAKLWLAIMAALAVLPCR